MPCQRVFYAPQDPQDPGSLGVKIIDNAANMKHSPMESAAIATQPPRAQWCWRALWRSLGAVLLGALQACSLAWPAAWAWPPLLPAGQALWYLQVLATAGLYVLLQGQSVRTTLLTAWLFAFAWLLGAVGWIYTSLHVYGGLAAPLALAALAALAGFLASYFAVAAGFFRYFSLKWLAKPAQAAALFIAFWSMAELARNSWFTGFPWGASGYAHVQGPLAFMAPWAGVYGIAAAATALALSIAHLLRTVWLRRLPCNRWGFRQAGASLWFFVGLVLLLAILPQALTRLAGPAHPSQPPLMVDLLQGNISQGEKFDMQKGVPQALAWYSQQLQQSQADLVITPETAIPLLPLDLPAGYWLALQQHFVQSGQAALVGLPLGNEEDGYANSVVGLKPSGAATHYTYVKQHLVPFGEFIPPMFRWFTNLLQIPLGDFSRGDRVQPSFLWHGERLAPNICYEDLFGEELAGRFVSADTAPTILVNLSNLGWFGTGAVLDQHRNIARMRSLELDRPTLRATNTGVTALIDRHGVVQAQLPSATQGVLRVRVGGNTGITFFAWWAGRYGQLPLWLLAFVGLGVVFLSSKNTRPR